MKRSSENIDKIAIVSCGGHNEASFINRLSNINLKNVPQFVFQDYVNTGDSVLVMQLALSSYKELGLPLILLISKKFLELVWKTTSKGQILKTIFTYSTKYCVHVWFDDLTEAEVEKYSVGLCRKDSAFRRLLYSDLPTSDNELIGKLLALMRDTTEKISFENFSVQDERTSFGSKSTDFVRSISPSNYVFTEDIKPTFIKKESKSLPPQQSPGNNNKKKHKRRKAVGNHYQQAAAALDIEIFAAKSKLRLSDICLEDRNTLTAMLDVGYGANWKQIAAYYELTATEISNIELAVRRDVGPSETLFQVLETRLPDLDIKDLQEKCRKISRNDVAQEIGKILVKSGK